MFLLYNLFVVLLVPFWLPYAWFRARKRREPVRWAERFGNYDIKPGPDRIWLHAVSVGEVHAAVPILRELSRVLPGYEIVLSTTTSSGQQAARDGAEGLYDHLVYFPLDVARFALNAMIVVRPKAVLVMETELWMNFLWAAQSLGARTALLNGRISDRSFRRASRLRFFYRILLRFVDLCLMQSQEDRARIVALGAEPGRAEVVGNVKFDQALTEETDSGAARQEFGVPQGAPCVVVGSTRSAEEERLVLAALAAAREAAPNLYFILAPRHVERADEVEAIVRQFGFTPIRRSDCTPQSPAGDCLLLDTFGELARAYAAGDVAVVGGGFGEFGGQNIFQPLALGKPTFFGPHMTNFKEITALAKEEGIGFEVDTAQALAEGISGLLQDERARTRIGEKAGEVMARNVGAAAKYVERVAALLAPSSKPTT